jgi:hypothetical protein
MSSQPQTGTNITNLYEDGQDDARAAQQWTRSWLCQPHAPLATDNPREQQDLQRLRIELVDALWSTVGRHTNGKRATRTLLLKDPLRLPHR